ncbi:MAG TPA: hypothetical protein VFE03_02745 [Caulobacteraceae bacterium]|jgi:hypothetical protein|nr:hypothetical protein [Caulobacteraceae bacterium]
MTALPDPSELAPSRDPADYGRSRLFTTAFWAMISLCILCVLAGAAVVKFAPMIWPKPAPPGPSQPAASAAASPAPLPAAGPSPVATPAPDAAGALTDRVGRLEGDQARTVDAAAAALAAAALSDAAAQPRPFADDLAAIEKVLPPSPDLRALRPLAATGAPTRAALAAELDELSSAAAVEARAPAKGAGILDQLGYVVSRVITLRRIDGSGTGAEAALAKAQRRAADGDLEGAVAILDGLPGARQRLADWRLRAERRIEIDRHVAGLRAQALAELAAVQRARP